MSLSSYFSDNQTKQKAYDAFYNKKAKSDFVQRRKLKKLIEQEAADEAITDQLAKLYMASVGKSPEYEYDQVSKTIQKSQRKPQKQVHTAVQSRFASKLKSKVGSSPGFAAHEKFKSFVDEDLKSFINSYRSDEFKAKSFGDAEEIAKREAERYVKAYQKQARADKTSGNRVFSKAEAAEAQDYIIKNMMAGHKRARKESNDVVSMKPNAKRVAHDESEELDDEKADVESTNRASELNVKSMRDANQLISSYRRQKVFNQFDLKKDMSKMFKNSIDKRMGAGYFDGHYPKISTEARSLSSFNNHIRNVRDFMARAFPI